MNNFMTFHHTHPAWNQIILNENFKKIYLLSEQKALKSCFTEQRDLD